MSESLEGSSVDWIVENVVKLMLKHNHEEAKI